MVFEDSDEGNTDSKWHFQDGYLLTVNILTPLFQAL